MSSMSSIIVTAIIWVLVFVCATPADAPITGYHFLWLFGGFCLVARDVVDEIRSGRK